MTKKSADAVVVATTNDQIVEAAMGDAETLTMYALAGVMSGILGVRVREQMLYNYRAKKMIRVNSEGRVERAVAIEFIVKRMAKADAAMVLALSEVE